MSLRILTPVALLLALGLASCGDSGASGQIAAPGNPPAPSPPPDDKIINPGGGTGGTTGQTGTGGGAGGGAGGGSGGTGGGGGAPVPEPGTMLLVGTGLAGAALYWRRQRKLHQAS